MKLKENIDKILDRVENQDGWMATEEIMRLIENWAYEIADAPIRSGDRLPTDEIIEDGARESLVRTVIKEAIEDSLK